VSTNIQFIVDVFPRQFQGGVYGTLMITATNANPTSKTDLINDDWFEFELDSPWGNTLRLSSSMILNSPSGALNPADFSLTVGARSVRVNFIGQPCAVPPGEGFAFVLRFMAPKAFAFGVVTTTGSQSAGRLDPITPTYTTLAFTMAPSKIDAPDGEPITVGGTVNVNGGQTNVNGGSTNITGGQTNVVGGTTNVEGGNTTVTGGGTTVTGGNTTVTGGSSTITGGTTTVAGGSVDVGAGTTVNISPGAIVNVTAGPGSASAAPSGPNFLQVAAAKWYEAANLQRITLTAPAGALVFDGRNVWAALSGTSKLARIDVATGSVTEVAMTVEGTPLSRSNPVNAMVYDGEKFWISGVGVVLPDGSVLPRGVPDCERGAMIFDGTSMWFGNSTVLTRIPADSTGPGESYYLSEPIVGLAFDGKNIWVAGGVGSRGTLLRIQANDLQAGTPQNLGFEPSAIAYDGSHLWLSDSTSNAVRKWKFDSNSDSCSLVASYSAGLAPRGLLFDGSSMWIANGIDTVTKRRVMDGALLGTFLSHPDPGPMVFDGINVWVASSQNSVQRF